MASYCNLTSGYSSTQHLHRSVSTCLIYWYLLSRDVWRTFRMKDTYRIRRYQRWPFFFGANRVKRWNFSEGLEASIGSHYLQLHCHCLWKIYSNTVVTCQNTLFGAFVYGNSWCKRGILPGIWFAVDSSRWGGWEANNWQVTSFEMLLV